MSAPHTQKHKINTKYITILALLLSAGCNPHAVEPFTETLHSERSETTTFAPPRLDILWVIDNSGSMCEEQQSLRTYFEPFIQHLAGAHIDFQLAIITTDMTQPTQSGRFQNLPDGRPGPGCNLPIDISRCPGVLGADTTQPQNVLPDDLPPLILRSADPRYRLPDGRLDLATLSRDFGCSASVGVRGDGFERGLDATRAALSPPLLSSFNQGFLRDDADLAIIFLTDENDCSHTEAISHSNGNSCEWERHKLTPVADYIDFLHALKPEGRQLLLAGIIAPDDELRYDEPAEVLPSCTSSAGQGFSGYRYSELIATSDLNANTTSSICEPQDFALTLDRLGFDLSDAIAQRCLDAPPLTCTSNDDCGGDTCAPRTQDGPSFCPDFTLQLEVRRDPGATPIPGADCELTGHDLRCILKEQTHYTVNWSDAKCTSSHISTRLNLTLDPNDRITARYPQQLQP
jgi:hypothetical protein